MTSAQSAISAVTFFHGTDFTPSFFFFFLMKSLEKNNTHEKIS